MEVIQVFDRPASRSFYTVAGRFLFIEADLRLAQLVQQLFAGWQLTPTSPPPCAAEIEIRFFGDEPGPDIPGDLNQFDIAEGGRCYTEANAYYLQFGNSLLRLRQDVPVALNVKTGGVLAMASDPSYDPNVFAKGVSASVYKHLQDPDNGAPLANRLDRPRLLG